MQIRRFGHSGLALSALSLGTLTWGRDTYSGEAQDLYQRFRSLGGTTLDVPSDYGNPMFEGRCETVGSVIDAEDLQAPVLILHSHDPSAPAVDRQAAFTSAPASRSHLLASLDYSLEALGRTNVDLWMVHGPRLGVQHREIAWTLREAVRSGRTRYVGLAGMDAWDYGAITSELEGTEAPVSGIAGPFSLLHSEPALNLLPHCVESGLGFVALAPLASGVLTGKYRHSTPADSRAASSHLGPMMGQYLGEDQARVVQAVVRVAEGLGVSPAAVATAWVKAQPAVATCVIGPRSVAQLDAIIEGYETRLPRELRDALTEVSCAGG